MSPTISRARRKRMLDIPYEQQISETHCGAACLSMIYAHYGVKRHQAQIWEENPKLLRGSDEIFHTYRLVGDALGSVLN